MPANWTRALFGTRVPNRLTRRANPPVAPRRRGMFVELLEDRAVPDGSAPSLSFSNAAVSVNEGTLFTRSGKVLDFEDEAVSLTTNVVGASISPSGFTAGSFAGGTAFQNFTFSYTPANGTAATAVPVAKTLTATDTPPFQSSSSATFNVSVLNVAPTTTTPADQVAIAGKPIQLNLGQLTDPGVESSWTVEIDYDYTGTFAADQTYPVSGGAAKSGFQLSAAAASPFTAGAHAVAVRVFDGDDYSTTKTFTVTAATDVSPTYVSGTFSEASDTSGGGAGLQAGDTVNTGFGTAIYGYDAWPTINDARQVTTTSGTIRVLAGTYAEQVTLGKAVSLIGPNSGTAGSGSRVAEAVIQAPTGVSAVVQVNASNVTVRGFTIDGDAAAAGTPVYSGRDANALYGVTNLGSPTVGGLSVRDNIIQSTAIGVRGQGPGVGVGVSSGNLIDGNLMRDIGVYDFGYGVTLRENFYADVTNNVMRRVWSGIHINNFNGTGGTPPGSWSVSSNDIQSYAAGAWLNQAYGGATPLTFGGNSFQPATDLFSGSNPAPVANNIGVLMTGGPGYAGGTFTSTTVSGHAYGLVVYGTTPGVTFGATNAFSGNGVGVYVTDSVGFNPIGTTNLNTALYDSAVTLDGAAVTGSTSKGVWVRQTGGGLTVTATLQNGTAIGGAGGGTGLALDGASAKLGGNSLNNTAFAGYVGSGQQFIVLANGAYGTGTVAQKTIAGTAAIYNGLAGSSLTRTSSPTGFAVEDRITHHLDAGTLGFVRTTAATTFVTPASGSIQRAVNVSAAGGGDTVYVAAGTYAEQVTIDRGLSLTGPNDLIGAGKTGAGTRVGEAIVTSPSAKLGGLVDFTSSSSGLVNVTAGGVVIAGFTLDGANPGISGGVLLIDGTTDGNAAEGVVVTGTGAGTVSVSKNIVKNFYASGVRFGYDNDPALGPNSTGTVSDGTVSNIGFDPSAAGTATTTDESYGLYSFGSSAGLSNSVVTGAQRAVYFDTTNLSGGATPIAVTGNTIAGIVRGLTFEETIGATPQVSVTGNAISLAAGGRTGLAIWSVYNPLGFSVSGNTVGGAGGSGSVGVSAWNVFVPVTISGGTVGGFETGVLVSNELFSTEAAQDTTVTLSGVAVTATTGNVGVLVQDGPVATTKLAVVTLTGGTTVTGTGGTGTGVRLDGPLSQATLSGSTVSGLATGVSQAAGSLTVTGAGNGVTGNTTGIDFAGGTATVAGVNFDSATDNGTDLRVAATGLTVGAANQFAGDTFFIDNQSTTNYALTGGNAQSYDEASNFRIEDKMHHRVDTDLALGKGLITWVASQVYVTAPGGGSTDSSLQRGVDAVPDASTGWTVNVEAGSYPQSVTVNESVTLLGAGKASTTLTAPVVSGSAVVSVTAPGVTIDGFTLVVTQAAGNTGVYYGVAGTGSTWTGAVIQNTTITTAGAVTANASRGVYFDDPTSSQAVTVRASLVTGNGSSKLWRGIETIQAGTALIGGATVGDGNTVENTAALDVRSAFAGAGGTADIRNNTFLGAGVEVTEPNGGSTTQIRNNTFAPAVDGYRQSVFVNHNYAAGATVAVTNNQITVRNQGESGAKPAVGVFVGGSAGVTVSNNTFTALTGATNFILTLVDTQFREGGDGVQFGDDVPDALVFQGNTLTGSDVAGGVGLAFYNGNSTRVVTGTVFGSQYGAYTVGGAGALANSFGPNLGKFIQYNAVRSPIFGNTGPTVPGPVTLALDASQNTFDVGSGPQLPSAMTLAGKYALEQKLVHKPDSSALGLITVVANAVYVPATQTIQGGIDAVPDGSTGWTVNVQAGTYDETVTVNEDVTLLGAGKATTSIAPTTTGANNAVVNVTAPGVTIDGFTVSVAQPTNRRGIYAAGDAATAWTGLLVQNNTLTSSGTPDNTSRGVYVGDTGPGFAGTVTVRANDFTGSGAKGFWWNLQLDQVKTATVGGASPADGNTFAKSSTLDVRAGFAAAAGTTDIRNNTFAGGGVEATEPNGGATTIRDNAFAPAVDGYRQAVFVNHNYVAGATVAVTNNQFTVRGVGEAAGRPGVGVFVGGSAGVTVGGNTFNAVSGATDFVYLLIDTQQREGSDGVQFGDDVPDSLAATGNLFNSSDVAGGRALAFYNGNSTRVVTGTVSGSQYGAYTLGGAGALANTFGGSLAQFIQYNTGRNPIFPLNVGPTVPGAVTLALDATQNLFDVGGGPQLPTALTLAGKFALEQKITHKADNTALGLVTVVANNVYVPATTNTIQRGIDAVPDGSTGWTVNVQAGLFAENLLVNESVALAGPNAGVSASSGAPRGTEAVIQGVGGASPGRILNVTASGVSVRGFTLDGRDPLVATGSSVQMSSGAYSNTAEAVRNTGTITGLTVQNNIVQNVGIGVRGDGASTGNTVDNNWFRDVGAYDYGYAVSIRTNFYADVTNNKMTQVHSALHTNNFFAAGPGSWKFQNNTVQAYAAGVWYGLTYSAATPLTIDGNTISVLTASNTVPSFAQFDGKSIGVLVISLQDTVPLIVTNNTITGMGYGLVAFNTVTTGANTVGGTNTISNSTVAGVYLTDIVGFNPVTSTILGGAANNPNGVSKLTLDGLVAGKLSGNATGVLVRGTNTNTPNGAQLTLQNGVVVGGGATGLRLDGANATLGGATLANTTFTGQSGQYVVLSAGAYNAGPNAGTPVVAAGGATFDGVVGGSATTAQAFAIEDKVTHQIDDAALGFVQLQANKAFVTANSGDGAVQRGVTAEGILTNGKVYVNSGNHTGDVQITQTGLQLLGVGATRPVLFGTRAAAPTNLSGSTVQVAASNVVVSGFDITREGNNPTDWNDNLNTAGLSVQGTSFTGIVVSGNSFYGNRTGIDLNNVTGVTVTQNRIDNNRTGLILRNAATSTTITKNEITNNWTAGVLWLVGGGGEDFTGSTLSNNNISGNWDVQLENRSTTPFPKNVTGNWFGTNAPTVLATDVANAAYGALIPVGYGGSSVAPMTPPTPIRGVGVAQVDFSPFLWTGTDADAGLGFDGDFTQLGVTTDGGDFDGGTDFRIGEAIAYNSGSATAVNVLAGTYAEAVNLTRDSLTVRLQGAATINSLAAAAGTDRKVDLNTFALTTGDASDTVFNGVFVGTGTSSVIKQGLGKFSVAGASPSYTGSLAVNAGTVDLTGSVGGATSVAATGTLTGTGTVGGALTNAGVVSPGGTAVGTLTVGGGYTQAGSGTLRVQATGAGVNDVLAVTGAVSLAGTLDVNFGTYLPAAYTSTVFVTNDGGDAIGGALFGTFTTLNSPSSFSSPTLTLTISGTSYPFLVAYGAGSGGNDFALIRVPTGLPLVYTFADAAWTGLADGTTVPGDADPVAPGVQPIIIGYSGYATAQPALNVTASNGFLTLAASPTSYGPLNFDTVSGTGLTVRLAAGTGTTVTVDDLTDLGPTATVIALNRFTLAAGGAADTVFGGRLTGVGTSGLLKQGAGKLTLTNPANDYKGNTGVAAGTLATGTDEVIPDAGTVTVAAGATLDLGGYVESVGGLAGDAGASVLLGTNGELYAGSNNQSTTFAGALTGAGSLVKVGTGTLTLTGANVHTGSAFMPYKTNVYSGTLELGAGGSVPGQIDTTGGTVAVNGPATVANVISGTGGVVVRADTSLTGANTFKGGLTVSGGTLSVAGDGNLGFAGGTVTVGSGGAVSLGANTYTGRTFSLSSGATLAAAGAVTLTNTKVSGGTLAGPGAVTSSGSTYTGVTIASNVAMTTAGAVSTFTNASIAGTVTVAAGTTASLTTSTVAPGGRLLVLGTADTSGLTVAGYAQVSGASGVVNLLGTVNLQVAAGGVFNVGINEALTAPGGANGTVNFGGRNITLNGVMRNNGTLAATPTPRTVTINFGGVFFTGIGTLSNVSTLTRPGGAVRPGNS